MNAFIDLSPQQLRKAADVKERIDSLQSELTRILGNNSRPASAPNGGRILSAASRARISAAAKKRWADIRRSRPSAKKPGLGPKKPMSAAAKARLSAIARARWKKARAEGRTAL